MFVLSSGRKQAASIIRAKEVVKAQAFDGEGQERGLGCGQAAAGGQEKIDGSEASGVSATELRHRKRRQHRNLRPRGPDPTLRTDQRRSWGKSCGPLQTLTTNTNWSEHRLQRMHRGRALIPAQLMTGAWRSQGNTHRSSLACHGMKSSWQMFNTIILTIIVPIIEIIIIIS